MKVNSITTAAAANYDSVRWEEISQEAEHNMFYYQEVMECKRAIESRDAAFIQERKNNVALQERMAALEQALKESSSDGNSLPLDTKASSPLGSDIVVVHQEQIHQYQGALN